jgi:hypothetical protein
METKRLLIAGLTFLAGLYYFLEFVLPPTVPWRTVEGVVADVRPNAVLMRVDSAIVRVPVQPNRAFYRQRPNATYERVEPTQLAPGDRLKTGPTTYLTDWLPSVNNFFVVLMAMAWGMGLISLAMVHGGNIRRRRPEWYNSVAFFIAVGIGVVAGMGYGVPSGWLKSVNELVFNSMLRPMGSTVFSLLAFHITTAAYRAFRVRSMESLVMILAALIVMLGQIPIGLWLTHALPEPLWLPSISQWLLYVVNTAAVRGMWFGIMLGALATGLRYWLSLERGAFFHDLEER